MIQILIGKGPDVTNNKEFERKLYIIRKLAEKAHHSIKQGII